MDSRKYIILLFALFLILRIPGLDLPYYQDERVWQSVESLDGIPHPPLTGIFFIVTLKIFGADNLRFLPLAFGAINFWLLYLLVKRKFSEKAAVWSVFLFTISFYSVLASLMLDTDGQILPFFFLLVANAYYRWQDSLSRESRIKWAVLLAVSILGGFLTKLGFIVAFGAIVLDFIYARSQIMPRGKLIKLIMTAIGSVLLFLFLTLSAMYFLSEELFNKSISYWSHFFTIGGRNYLQILIQLLKSIMYASPVLAIPVLLLKKDLVKKLSLFISFMLCGLVFYLVIFDFSSGALDRYLQFAIVPLSVISGVAIAGFFEKNKESVKSRPFALSLIVLIFIFIVQFLPHFVPALYPKEEWFGRVLNLKWNFVFPFTGGSGPMGFYVSWLFIALIWLTALILAIIAILKPKISKLALVSILLLGLSYNIIFIEEYLFGKINGSSPSLLVDSIEFIKNNKDVKKVITYNNIGIRELTLAGKYERRLYVAPKFEESYQEYLAGYSGHYFILEVPRIDPQSPYSGYFKKCITVYEKFSGKIPAYIYDCRGARF